MPSTMTAMATVDTIGAVTLTLATSVALDMFEGYQKVFIANGTVAAVVEFANDQVQIETATLASTTPTKGDILYTTSGVTVMVVDFVNSARSTIYGYRTAGDTFTDGDSLTSTLLSVSIGIVTAAATYTAGPFWHNWSVYPSTGVESATTYGTFPSSVSIGCLYRGRCVTAGNPSYPHQWYMSRQANPYDFAYVANDGQSPVAGSDADAGEIGDIVTALIPYKDDYLVIGCANSIWVLRGDPAAGGSLDEISLTTGIFGKESWAWDAEHNLYFFGNNGLQVIPPGFGPPQHLSDGPIPQLMSDWAPNPETHRITMQYDRDREGITINRTVLANGSSLNYWYDLRAKGFFPEAYPDECGVYSAHFYEASDNAFRKTVLGCKDGYIRTFEDSDKDDDIGDTDQAIESKVLLGPGRISSDDDTQGVIKSLTFITGGGAGTSRTDTDALEVRVFSKDTAEDVLESVTVASTPLYSVALNVPGRVDRKRTRLRGIYAGIQCVNTVASSTWAMEKVVGEVKEAGKKKGK